MEAIGILAARTGAAVPADFVATHRLEDGDESKGPPLGKKVCKLTASCAMCLFLLHAAAEQLGSRPDVFPDEKKLGLLDSNRRRRRCR